MGANVNTGKDTVERKADHTGCWSMTPARGVGSAENCSFFSGGACWEPNNLEKISNIVKANVQECNTQRLSTDLNKVQELREYR